MSEWPPEQQAEHRRIWVEALRSGKYQQARGALRRDDAMCCLGVACDISNVGTWHGPAYSAPGEECVSILPSPVREWLGLSEDNGTWSKDAEEDCLAFLNDHGTTFAEIAYIIESEPPGLIVTPEPAKPEVEL